MLLFATVRILQIKQICFLSIRADDLCITVIPGENHLYFTLIIALKINSAGHLERGMDDIEGGTGQVEYSVIMKLYNPL